MVLSLEEDLRAFVADASKQVLKFPAMSSYNRMLVHRIAAFFGLDHNVDQSGGSVVVTKTGSARLPEQPFRSFIRSDVYLESSDAHHTRRLGLANSRREIRSCEEVGGGGILERGKARSFEERGSLHVVAQDSVSSAEVMESPMSGYSSGSGATSCGGGGGGGGVQITGWSSTDSGEGGSHHLRPVSSTPYRVGGGSSGRLGSLRATGKAGSFSGVPTASASPQPRPSPRRGHSSELNGSREALGMGRQASIPECGLPPPPPHPQPIHPPPPPPGQILIAVPSWDQVPPGAIVLNPSTYTPYLNPDGSFYYHQPQPQPYPQPHQSYAGPPPQAHYAPPAPPPPPGMQQAYAGMAALSLDSAAPPPPPPPQTASVLTYVVPSFPPQTPAPTYPTPHPAYAAAQPMQPQPPQPGPAQPVPNGTTEWSGSSVASSNTASNAPLSASEAVESPGGELS